MRVLQRILNRCRTPPGTLRKQLQRHQHPRLPDIIPNLERRIDEHSRNFEQHLKADIDRTRGVIHSLISDGVIIREGGAIYAEMQLNMAPLLLAAGAESYNDGSGPGI